MNDVKVTGKLKKYMQTPLLMVFILIAANAGVYFISIPGGIVFSAGIGIYIIALAIIWYLQQKGIFSEMVGFALEYGQVQKQLMLDLSIPYAVTDSGGKVLWFNDAFAELTGKEQRKYNKSLTGIFSEIKPEKFPKEGELADYEIDYGSQHFRIEIRHVTVRSLVETSNLLEHKAEGAPFLYTVFLFNETILYDYMQKYRDEKMVVGLVYLDNYDEALNKVEEVQKSLASALIDQKLNQYFGSRGALVKKLEKDKYFVVMRTETLDKIREEHFAILNEIKKLQAGSDMELTLSIGIGAGNDSYTRNEQSARIAMDLALGRGGDQAVVSNGDSITYYGGKSQGVEKNTRVKARVKAHALREFIDSKEKVVVMGHRLADIDCFGAAIGIYRAAQTQKKKAYIVIDNPTSSTKPFIEVFRKDPAYDKDLFVTMHEAQEMVNRDTLLVVVDTNTPDYTECQPLLGMTDTIMVLDHHRQTSNYIKNATLSYIEPYASSACEMVAEILQYFSDELRLRNIEADAIYAGIMMDTDNFMQKTGVRTFEAAAYLRRCGADVTRVRKMFRERLEDYQLKGETISNAEMFRGQFAISISPSAPSVESPTIVGAQAANQLLDVVGVRASFVLTEYKNTIYISARAIDEVNVQIIMERMGGGGHLNIAGCQLEKMSMSEAVAYLKNTLDEMLDGGEIA
ncbi:MAG: DHH family phosphoesterase [Eubacterium sp.]|nr:DHH family phosphoesterase [Eubacterium sp.]